MPITDWPKADRPREKLLQKGASTLTDAELIAVCIQTGGRGYTALDIAKKLLAKFTDLKHLLAASPSELGKVPGLGEAKFAILQAACEMGRRSLKTFPSHPLILNNSVLTSEFLHQELSHYTYEVFACLFLDKQLKLLGYEELSHGTIDSAHIYPREIIKRALYHNACNIILAHNHPSGLALPSEADRELTSHLCQALGLLSIKVIDHVIIGAGANFSFAEMGLLA